MKRIDFGKDSMVGGQQDWPAQSMPDSFPVAFDGVFAHVVQRCKELGVDQFSAQRLSSEQAESVCDALMLDLQHIMESPLLLFCASKDVTYCSERGLSHVYSSIKEWECVKYKTDTGVNPRSSRHLEFYPHHPKGVFSFPIDELKMESISWFEGVNHVILELGPCVLQVEARL